ncbi:hypothetical protein QOT17_017560 [Balamuthia mandrillaris]
MTSAVASQKGTHHIIFQTLFQIKTADIRPNIRGYTVRIYPPDIRSGYPAGREGRLEQQESTRARNQRRQQDDHREKPIRDFLQQRYGFVLPSGKRLTVKHMKDHMRRVKGDYPQLRLCLGNRREETVNNFLQFLEQLGGQQQQQQQQQQQLLQPPRRPQQQRQ